MDFKAINTSYASIELMREAYRAEAECQIVADSSLARGIADSFALLIDGETVGYAGVYNRDHEGRVAEFFVKVPVRRYSNPLFESLVIASQATHIRAQSNMPQIMGLAFDFAEPISVESVLFAEDT